MPEVLRARFGYPVDRLYVTGDGVRLRAGRLSCRSMNFGSFYGAEDLPRAGV